MSIAHADDKKIYGEISAGRYTKKHEYTYR